MPGTVAECPSCGKKFRIPEGTLMAEFACKACGTMIPLDEEPKRARRRAAAGEGAEEGAGGRRGRRAAPKKSNMPLILGGVGAVVVVVVLALLFSGGDEKPAGGPGGRGTDTAGSPTDPGTPGPNIPPDPEAAKKLLVPEKPEATDFGGLDKTEITEIRKFYKDAPQGPKLDKSKVNPDGTVQTEEWNRYHEAEARHNENMKQFYAKLIEMGKAFLSKYPNSQYEKEVVGAVVLTSMSKTGNDEGLITLCEEYLTRFPYMKRECLAFKGDAENRLERYEAAAATFRERFEVSVGRDAITAGTKYIQTLIKCGKGTEAVAEAERVKRTTPEYAKARFDAILRPLQLRGKPLPTVPGANLLNSDSPIDWSTYKGKIVLVLIWTNQEEEPKAALRDAKKLDQKLSGDVPFQVVGIALSEKEDDQKIDQWLRQQDMPDWPQVVQVGRWSQSPVLRAWGLAWHDEKTNQDQLCGIPLTFLLDKGGIVQYAGVPVGAYMEKLIRGMR